MEEKIKVFLAPVNDWRFCLQLAAAVYSAAGRELFMFNPGQLEEELQALAALEKRLSVEFIDCSGDTKLRSALKIKADLCFKGALSGPLTDIDQLIAYFGQPRGLICAPAADPSRCLKAATLSVRLGYYFLALEEGGALPSAGYENCPKIWLGSKREILAPQAALCLENDQAVVVYLKRAGCPVDYLVIVNSADLKKATFSGRCLGELWVQNLSLFAVVLASYRRAFVFDAAQKEPDSLRIEQAVNDWIRQTGLVPQYQVVVASPGVVPFIYQEKKNIGDTSEEMVRDIHLRLNDDLFFDLAEGRLFQHRPGGLSLQLLSTKRYQQIRDQAPAGGKYETLIVSAPNVESGIIFATDEVIIEAQLLPLLEQADCRVKLLAGKDAHVQKIGEALALADIFLYTGHGGPEALHTHGRPLTRYDLPALPPLVAYASACSTVGLTPHWYSPDQGLNWQGIPIDSREIIGLSLVEKGALCFVGGTTIEDLQYSSSIYNIFMEALLVKGLSIGEAVRETRNFISLYAATLLQKAPQAYEKYRWGTANAIQQQLLLGDPAFAPVGRESGAAALPMETVTASGRTRLTVKIPAERWRRSEAVVNEKEPSNSYYRCRGVKLVGPFGLDVINWGDYYRVAPDADNISATALLSSFLHLKLDLPPETVPVALHLLEAEGFGPGECLLCGKEALPVKSSVLDRARRFKLPYLLQPPLELDMREGWAFSVERRQKSLRVHWLVPLMLIDEPSCSALPLEKFTFEVETSPALLCRGEVKHSPGIGEGACCLIAAGAVRQLPEKNAGSAESAELIRPAEAGALPFANCQFLALTRPGGAFELCCSAGASLALGQQFPLYELPGPYCLPGSRVWPAAEAEQMHLNVSAPPEPGLLLGRVYDSRTGAPLKSALIRLFRGEIDPVGDPLLEAYVGEAITGAEGEFSIGLPEGKYLLYAAAVTDRKRYRSGEWVLKIRRGEERYHIFALDEAVVIRGRVDYEGDPPVEPVTIAIRKFPRVAGGTLVKMPLLRDGSYECLVGFQERFMIVLEEEGWHSREDNNGGSGYKLEPGEILERNFTLIPDDGR